MKNSLVVIFGLLTISLLFSNCSSDEDEVNKEAPELPPKASLIADFGNFPQNENGRVDQTKLTYGFAALNVAIFQGILTVDLLIPTAAFAEAFNHSFTFNPDDKKWKSEYEVTVAGQTITAELYAEVINDGEKVRWEMYLSGNGFEDFLWFTGESKTDGSGGDWVLYKSPDHPREILQVTWERINGTAIGASYTFTDEEADKVGSSIAYGLTDEAGFTHFYNVSVTSKAGSDYNLEIYFNAETKVGKVKSESWFKDTEWHCWDENLLDTEC